MSSEEAWKVFNFIRDYQNGEFGLCSLQKALDEHYENYKVKPPLKHQIGDMI